MPISARRLPSIFAALTVGAAAAVAQAGDFDTTALVTVRAWTATGLSGEFRVQLQNVNFNADQNRVTWSRPQPMPITDPVSGALIATVQSVSVSVTGTTLINLNCTVRAAAANITCEVDSVFLSFPTQAPDSLTGRATASLSVSDLDGDGAQVVGVGPAGTGVFKAEMSGVVQPFTQLVGQIIVGPTGTAAASQSDPPVGVRPVGVGPDGMTSRLAYTLSRNDLAAATTSFELRNVVGFQLFDDGDMNCDRILSPSDISPFVLAVTSESNYDGTFPNCNFGYADLNLDGKVTVSDIGAFVTALLAQSAPSDR